MSSINELESMYIKDVNDTKNQEPEQAAETNPEALPTKESEINPAEQSKEPIKEAEPATEKKDWVYMPAKLFDLLF